MPKYKVSTSITEYYLSKEVEANNAEEAERLYLEDIEYDRIPVVNQDYGLIEIEEINN